MLDDKDLSLVDMELQDTVIREGMDKIDRVSAADSHMLKLQDHKFDVISASQMNSDVISEMNHNSRISVPSRVWNSKLVLHSNISRNDAIRPRKFSCNPENPPSEV